MSVLSLATQGSVPAGRLSPHLYIEVLPPAMERVFGAEVWDERPLPRLRLEIRAEWDGDKAAAIYGTAIGLDHLSSHTNGAHMIEASPLPGMETVGGRIAWSSAALGGLLILDHALYEKLSPRWAHRLRWLVVIVESITAVANWAGWPSPWYPARWGRR